MDTRFYNTLTNSIELFTPIDSPRVSMYNCGPTVYDYAHIGNFRFNVWVDVLHRALEWAGYDVKHAWGHGGHNSKHATAILPDVMTWLWRDYPRPITNVAGTPAARAAWMSVE